MSTGDIISFGPYRLIPAERLLLRDGALVTIGSRALDGTGCIAHSDRESTTRLMLQAFLAASAMFTRGNNDDVRSALEEALSLAERLGDREYQMHLQVGLSIFLFRIGDFRGAIAVAQCAVTFVKTISSPRMIAAGKAALGVAYHSIGDQIKARHHCESALTKVRAGGAAQVSFFGYDQELRARVALVRCEWVIGLPDRAAKTAHEVIYLATQRDRPVDLCNTLVFASTVFLWRGDIAEAEQLIGQLNAHAARHSLGPYIAAGLGLTGELALARGRAAEGVTHFRHALEMSRAQKYYTRTLALHLALAECLLRAREIEELRRSSTPAWRSSRLDAHI